MCNDNDCIKKIKKTFIIFIIFSTYWTIFLDQKPLIDTIIMKSMTTI